MKNAVLALSLLAMSSLSYATDFVTELNERCSDMKDYIGPRGSCRTIITPKPISKSGVCTGSLFENVSCMVKYMTSTDGRGIINLLCMTGYRVDFDESMMAEATGYNTAMLLRSSNGQDLVVNDPLEISVITNSNISVIVYEAENNGSKIKNAEITLNLESRKYSLSDVVCQ